MKLKALRIPEKDQLRRCQPNRAQVRALVRLIWRYKSWPSRILPGGMCGDYYVWAEWPWVGIGIERDGYAHS